MPDKSQRFITKLRQPRYCDLCGNLRIVVAWPGPEHYIHICRTCIKRLHEIYNKTKLNENSPY